MYFGIKKKFEPVKTAKLNFIMPENIFLPAYFVEIQILTRSLSIAWVINKGHPFIRIRSVNLLNEVAGAAQQNF